MACNPDCLSPCCNASAKPCGCQSHECCSSCDPEEYFRDEVDMKQSPVHLLRPDASREAYCGVNTLNVLVTRNPAHVTCKHCSRRFAPWYFKLTYVPRLLLGFPLLVMAFLGEKSQTALFWLHAKTWAPYRK